MDAFPQKLAEGNWSMTIVDTHYIELNITKLAFCLEGTVPKLRSVYQYHAETKLQWITSYGHHRNKPDRLFSGQKQFMIG